MKKFIPIILLQILGLAALAQERQWFSEAEIEGLNFPGDARNSAVSFVIGDTAYVGTGDNGSTTTDFWKYVPSTKTWTQIADFEGARRGGAVAFTLGNKGYVGAGKGAGSYYQDFWEYDPTNDTWTEIASLGGDGRSNAVAFALNGMAYVGSGNTQSESLSDFWKYDPNTNTWTQIASLPGNARTNAFSFSANGLGYVGGGARIGTNYEKDLYSYNPAIDVWEAIDGLQPFKRENCVAFVLDGRAYMGLGLNSKDFVTYDFSTGNIDKSIGPEDNFGPSGETTRWGAVAFVIQGKAFVGLGGAGGGELINNDFWSFQYPIPEAPEGLTAVATSLTDATLAWNDRANNEQGFAIERSVGDSTSFVELASVAMDVTSYEDNTLTSNQVYYYKVRALGQSDHSPYTKIVSVNTYGAPDNLTVALQNTNDVVLAWQDNSDIENGFVVERSANGITFSTIATLEADVVTYTDVEITAGTDYQYRVYAFVDDVNTDATNTATIGILAAPSNLSVVSTNSSTVQLAWRYYGSNATQYVIERKTGDGDFIRIDSAALSTNQRYSDTEVDEGQQYTYRVRTNDDTRVSDYSSTVQTTTSLHSPQLVTATVRDSSIVVEWRDVSQREIYYVVRRSFADGSGIIVMDTLGADTTSFRDTTPIDSINYRYIIHAVGIRSVSANVGSNTVTFIPVPVVEEPEEEPVEEEQPGEEPVEEEQPVEEEPEEETVTGIEDGFETETVKVYPNPSHGAVSVYVGSERFAYIAVFNSQGRLVREVQQAEQGSRADVQVDLQHFSAGMYTLRIYTAHGIVTKKIAIQ